MCNCNHKCCGKYLPIRCCCKPKPPPHCPEVKKLPPKKPCQKPCCNPCQKPCCNPCQKPCCNPCQKPCCNPCKNPCKPKHCCPDLTRPLPLQKDGEKYDIKLVKQDQEIQDLIKKIF